MRFVRRFCVPFTASVLLMGGHAWAQSPGGPPQRVVVKWASGAASVPSGQIGSVSRAMSDMQATFGVTMLPMRTLVTGGQVMRVSQPMPPAGLQNLIAMLAQNAAVEYAHEDVLLKAAQDRCEVNCTMYLPDDPLYGQQFHLVANNTTSRVPRPPFLVGRFSSVWGEKSGNGVRVAVVDSGITTHPDLAANLLPGYDFISDPSIALDGDGRDASPLDPGDFAPAGACGPGLPATNSTWHGTHVSGLIAAVSGNSLGVVGVARNAKVLPVRALGRCGGFLSDIAEAVIWAAGGTIPGVPANPTPAQVINLSLSGPGRCNQTSQQVIDIARALGAVIVVAAGNDNASTRNFIPASCSGVIVVGAVGRTNRKTSYSNTELVDITTFGGELDGVTSSGVLSTANAGATTPGAASYEYRVGTSMATAIVSGAVALMIENRPGRSTETIRSALQTTSDVPPTPCGPSVVCDPGILNPVAAIALPEDPNDPGIAPVPCTSEVCRF